MIVVTIPTYNESGNILPLCEELLALREDLQILVIDDDSPDGTWRLVSEMAAGEPRVHLLHRTADRGRGTAGYAGFARACEMGADWIVEMDGDYSHAPRFIPGFLNAAGADEAEPRADLVIGSRLIAQGRETERHLLRSAITRAANLYLRALFGFDVRDHTSGFRLYRAAPMRRLDLGRAISRGPSILQETLLAYRRLGARIVEVPIAFEPRRAGSSTFNARIAAAGLLNALRIRLAPGRLLRAPEGEKA